MKKLPATVSELIDELDQTYPEQPSTSETTREQDLERGGVRKLILQLKQRRSHDRGEQPKGQSRVRR